MKPYIHIRRMGTRLLGLGWHYTSAIVEPNECPWLSDSEPWQLNLAIYFGWFSIDIGITGPIPA